MDFVEQHQRGILPTPGIGQQMKRRMCCLAWRRISSSIWFSSRRRVDPLQIESDVGLNTRIGEAFRDSVAVCGRSSFRYQEGCTDVRVLDVRQQFGACALDASVAAADLEWSAPSG